MPSFSRFSSSVRSGGHASTNSDRGWTAAATRGFFCASDASRRDSTSILTAVQRRWTNFLLLFIRSSFCFFFFVFKDLTDEKLDPPELFRFFCRGVALRKHTHRIYSLFFFFSLLSFLFLFLFLVFFSFFFFFFWFVRTKRSRYCLLQRPGSRFQLLSHGSETTCSLYRIERSFLFTTICTACSRLPTKYERDAGNRTR